VPRFSTFAREAAATALAAREESRTKMEPLSSPYLHPNPNPNQVPRFSTFAREAAATALAAREESRTKMEPLTLALSPTPTLALAPTLTLSRRRA